MQLKNRKKVGVRDNRTMKKFGNEINKHLEEHLRTNQVSNMTCYRLL